MVAARGRSAASRPPAARPAQAGSVVVVVVGGIPYFFGPGFY